MLKNSWDNSFRYVVMVVLLIVLAATLWYVRDIFQPLVAAALIAYLLSPVINLVGKSSRLNRKQAANLVFFVVLAIIIALLVTIIPSLLRETQSLIRDLNSTLDIYQLSLTKPVNVLGIPVYLDGFIPAIKATLSTAIIPRPELAWQFLQTTSRGFLWFLVTIVSTYHLMTEWDRLREWLIGLAPESYQNDIRLLYMEIKGIWLGYLGGQVRLMMILAAIYAVSWSIIGLPGAILIGMLAGLLNLVPEVGPGLAALIAVVIAWLEGSNFLPISNGWFALLTIGVYLVLNNFKSIYLQPRILGQSVLLHEGVVFVATIAAIMLQGILGVLIVVPVLASAMILGHYIRLKLLGLNPFEDTELVEPESP
ncbi:MAG TPA: AI-2E family transporter [Anaerolineales bacterium]|jgi:predicted PurR-regulated permease PerM